MNTPDIRRLELRQRGATLLVALVLLVVLTLFALTMIRLSTGSLQVVGNMQAQKATEAVAQEVIEQKLGSITAFDDAVKIKPPEATTADCTKGTGWTAEGSTCMQTQTASGYTTKVYLPECIYRETSPGYPIDEMPGYSPPDDTYWDIKSTAEDSLTGARSEVHQGVKIQRTKGNC